MEKARLERWHADGRAARLDGLGLGLTGHTEVLNHRKTIKGSHNY